MNSDDFTAHKQHTTAWRNSGRRSRIYNYHTEMPNI